MGGGSLPLAPAGVLLCSTGALSAAEPPMPFSLFRSTGTHPSPSSATPSERPRLGNRESQKHSFEESICYLWSAAAMLPPCSEQAMLAHSRVLVRAVGWLHPTALLRRVRRPNATDKGQSCSVLTPVRTAFRCRRAISSNQLVIMGDVSHKIFRAVREPPLQFILIASSGMSA